MTVPGTLPAGDVGIVGPGRMGTVLAAALEDAGHTVAAAVGAGGSSSDRFSSRFPRAQVGTDLAALAGCDLLVIAVPDDALEEVAAQLAVADVVGEGHRVVHVAGSLGLEALRRPSLAGASTAACHPAQTVHRGDLDPGVLDGVAWAVTARPDDRAWSRSFVEQVGGVPHDVPEDRRTLYHAGLSLGSNAVGATVSVARQLLLAAAVDDPGAFLGPLVEASVANVLGGGAATLTGPVVRGDLGTVRRHLEELDRSSPELGAVYRSLTRVILAQVRPTLPVETTRSLDELLGGAE